MFTRTLLLAAFVAALTVAPAQADVVVDRDMGQPDMARRLVSYNGHAGLGASVYQHDQTDLEFLAVSSAPVAGITDGTSNTVMFGVR